MVIRNFRPKLLKTRTIVSNHLGIKTSRLIQVYKYVHNKPKKKSGERCNVYERRQNNRFIA